MGGGGRINPNLLTGSRRFDGYNLLYTWQRMKDHEDCTFYGRGLQWEGIYKEISIEAGVWYTFSVTILAENGVSFILPLLPPNGNYIGITQSQREFVETDKGYKRYSITFMSDTARTVRPRVEINKYSTIGDTWIQVGQYKLEKGKKATPWCPNIND